MAITIQMIESKEFKVVQRGYDPEEVDLFLDEIVDEFESMQKELMALRVEAERRHSPQAAPQAMPAPQRAERQERPSAGGASDETIRTMLVNTQRICDETLADARLQAQSVVEEAHGQAEDIVREARTESDRLEAVTHNLRATIADYRKRVQQMIQAQHRLLETELADPMGEQDL